MKKMAVLCALLAYFTSVNAQNCIDFDTNGLRIGDSLSVACLPYTDVGENGEKQLWDFSNLPCESSRDVWFVEDSVGYTKLIGVDENSHLRINKDSLLLSAYENPQLRICFDKPKLNMMYPLYYGDRHVSSFAGKGMYCGQHYLWKKGVTEIEADGEGTLILQEGDTLRNVLRVYCLTTASVRMSSDSLLTDSARYQQNIEERYLWFARGYRYPVFEVLTSTLYDEMEPIYTEQWSRKLRLRSECLVTDSINKEIQYMDSLSTANCNIANVISYTLTTENNRVIISYNLTAHARIHVIVADVMGVAHRNMTTVHDAGEGYDMQIDLNGLRRGRYIIYMNVNGKVFNHKVEVK